MEIDNQTKYPYLPEGRDLKHVPITNEFMMAAKQVAEEKSTDSVNPTGSVILKDGKIIGRAANISPLGHIKPLYEAHKKGFCIRRILKVKTGTGYWMCPGCAKPHNHSEQRAIKDAIKNGHDPRGADLYLWGHWWSCNSCWDKMIEAGIRNVYLLNTSEQDFKR